LNETIFRLIPETLADTLGISGSVVTIIILLGVAISVTTLVLIKTGSYILGVLVSGGVIIFGGFTGILPVWVSFLTCFIGAAVTLFTHYQDIGGGSLALHIQRNSKELVLRMEKSSERLPQYLNNLDYLLCIETLESTPYALDGLSLDNANTLFINPNYDWYLTEKHPDKDIFKVVGLHKEDDTKNRVYILGKDRNSGIPFLASVPGRYLEGSLGECLLWADRKDIPIPSLTESTYEGTTAVKSMISILPIVFTASILLGVIDWMSKTK